jgi:general secretion pathway protein C
MKHLFFSQLPRALFATKLLFVTGVSYLLADGVNQAIKNSILPPIRIEGKGLSGNMGSFHAPTASELGLIASRNPFSPDLRGKSYANILSDLYPSSVAGSDAAPKDADVVAVGNWMNGKVPILTPKLIKLRLVGTVLAGKMTSGAVIDSLDPEKQKFYRLHDVIVPGKITLIAVRKEYVVLQVGKGYGILKAHYDQEDDAGQDLPEKGNASVSAHGIHKIDDHHWLVEARAIQFATKNLSSLLLQARAIPDFTGGHPDGFRMVNIQSGSLFQELGLLQGDIIRSINGLSMNDPQNFMKALSTLQSATNVQINLLRNGAPQTFDYQIQSE